MAKLNCELCTNMPGGTGDLLLTINNKKYNLEQSWGFNDKCRYGYNNTNQRKYKPQPFIIPQKIPLNGGTFNFKLESICQYPLWSGVYPPNGPELGRLETDGRIQSVNYGYDITINFPPLGSGSNWVDFSWCGLFYASESQFSEECQTNTDYLFQGCEINLRFLLNYEECDTCLIQTAKLPSTRISAIIDHNNVSWPLGNGIFVECNVNSKDTKTALDVIKAKLIEIDKFYNRCVNLSEPKVTATAISEGNYCLLVKAENFVSKFRAIEHSGSVFAYFNHDNC